MRAPRTGQRRPDWSATFGRALELRRHCNVIGLQMRPLKSSEAIDVSFRHFHVNFDTLTALGSTNVIITHPLATMNAHTKFMAIC